MMNGYSIGFYKDESFNQGNKKNDSRFYIGYLNNHKRNGFGIYKNKI